MTTLRKICFVDRDGTLIEEPEDQQIDSLEKLRLVQGVIPALLKIAGAGYELVIVSNQDGLGTGSYPTETYEVPQQRMLELFESQGIRFSAVHIDPHFAHQNAPTRKPEIGMVLDYLRSGNLDMQASAMVGDRQTDIEFAKNFGVRGFLIGPNALSWDEIARELVDAPRRAEVERNTLETKIRVEVDLDHSAAPQIHTGLGFFDHMLEQLGKHGGFSLKLRCDGDLHIDQHHTVEDSALALGTALRKALGDKRGITRYAFVLPMDESRAEALLDLSGRPWFEFDGKFPRELVGDLPTEMVPHFFRSLCETLGANLHLRVEGDNAHHMVEGCFKAVARALRIAIKREGNEMPSTKGVL